MSDVLAHWRARYAPGEWIVLSGPTSMVVVQPLAAEWSTLLDTLWQEVLASSSIVELSEQLVAFGIADLPSFGAFFWSADGMRSLVRGGVVVLDAETGEKVADGQGVQTWGEVGLGGVRRVRIELPRARPGSLELPLVVGAALVSSVILDATDGAAVSSPQTSGFWIDDEPDTEPYPSPTDEPDDEGPSDAVRTLMEDASTELMPAADTLPGDQGSPGDDEGAAPLATLALSDGQQLDLVGVVRIGRAPSGEPGEEFPVHLVTVPSPQQDISRTHLQIHAHGEQVVVTDLHSTNGTMLVLPGTEMYAQRLPPGEAVAVPPGSLLDLGDGVTVSIELPQVRSSDPLI